MSHAIEHPDDPSPAARWPGPVTVHGPHPHGAPGEGTPAAQNAEAHHGEPQSQGPHSHVPQYYVPEPNRFSRFVVRMAERSPRWLAPASIALCFAGVASYVWVSNPTDGGAADMQTCLIKLTTGFDCPGCGGTRAFYYLMQGNVPEAARHHAIAVFAAPFLVWLYVAWAVKHMTGRQIPAPRIGAKAASYFLAAWTVFMVLRNLPWAPFTSLYV